LPKPQNQYKLKINRPKNLFGSGLSGLELAFTHKSCRSGCPKGYLTKPGKRQVTRFARNLTYIGDTPYIGDNP
jgi:hypothetical protein